MSSSHFRACIHVLLLCEFLCYAGVIAGFIVVIQSKDMFALDKMDLGFDTKSEFNTLSMLIVNILCFPICAEVRRNNSYCQCYRTILPFST